MARRRTGNRDEPADVAIVGRRTLFSGFRSYEAVTFDAVSEERGHATVHREVLKVGRVVAVLPYDPEADSVVLFRQFRIGAHEATGVGDLVEIVAGLAEPGEEPVETALREAEEEIGIPVLDLVPAFDFLPTPGVCDEHGFLFCGRVSSKALPAVAGMVGEGELTRPFLVPAREALRMARAPEGLRNGYTRLALFWFALNRRMIRRRWSAT